MKVFIVYCHPSEDSFTARVRDFFIKGILDSGNEYAMSDLYKMNFSSDMTEEEYLRDSNYINTDDFFQDVLEEQKKINDCDGIVFIYPVFWTEASSKLKGWFDRIWRYGFAYGTKEKDFIVFDGMTKAYKSREQNWDADLKKAYQKGKSFFEKTENAFSVNGRCKFRYK